MNERLRKQRVGLFVLMAIVILGILILANSDSTWVSQYDVYVKPPSAPGVTVGTPIRKNGILIGRVKGVSMDDEEGVVILKLGIDSDKAVFENEICKIGTESVLGDAKVEFIRQEGIDRGQQVAKDGSHTMANYVVQESPMDMLANAGNTFEDIKPQFVSTLAAVEDAGKEIKNAGEEFKKLAATVNNAVQDENGEISKLVQEMRELTTKGKLAVDNFNNTFETIYNVLDDPEVKKEFKNMIGEIPKIFSEIRLVVEDTREAVRKIGELPQKVDKTLSNVEVFSESLKTNGPEILTKVKTSLDSVDKFMTELEGVSELLERFKQADGTIVKLFEDDELYRSVLEAVQNVKKESHKIGPLIDDLRMFGDAISRDPGSLGVRGALDLRPEKTGDKGTGGRDNNFLRRF